MCTLHEEFILCCPCSLVYTVASRTARLGALLYYPLCVPYIEEFILCCPYSLVYTVSSRTARLGALLYYPLCVPYIEEFISSFPFSLVCTVASRTARLGVLLYYPFCVPYMRNLFCASHIALCTQKLLAQQDLVHCYTTHFVYLTWEIYFVLPI